MVGALPRARGGSWCWLPVGRSCCAGTCGMLPAAGTCRYSTARVPRPVGVSQLVVSGWPPPVRGPRPGLTRTLLRSGGCTIAVQCKQGTPSITQATTRSLQCIRNPAMRVVLASLACRLRCSGGYRCYHRDHRVLLARTAAGCTGGPLEHCLGQCARDGN